MLKVYKECCKNCLLSPDAIVSSSRVKEVIEECKNSQTHFTCHKSKDHNIVCKAFYDKLGHVSQIIRIAERLNMIDFVEQPKAKKLPTHKEMNNEK